MTTLRLLCIGGPMGGVTVKIPQDAVEWQFPRGNEVVTYRRVGEGTEAHLRYLHPPKGDQDSRRGGKTRAARVLVTGASGVVGRALLTGLGEPWSLTAVDRRRRGVARVHRADLRSARAAARCCRGHDVVVALAAHSSVRTPWRDVHHANLRITWNTLEGARRAGVRRVVLASTNNVTGAYELQEPYRSIVAGRREHLRPEDVPLIRTSDPVRPNGPYAVGKACDEAAGRYFSEHFGISVLCLRIGTVLAEDRPQAPRHETTLLTHRDLVQLVERCITAPDGLRFGVYYGVSANTWRIWDIADAERDLGFRPEDDASQLRTTGRGGCQA